MMILFHSKEELTKHIQNNMPIAIRPTKKSKTMYIDPFTSNNARKICIDAIVKSLERKINVFAMSSGGFGTTHYQNTTNDNRKHKR